MKRTLLWIVILSTIFTALSSAVLWAETLPPCCKKETAKEESKSRSTRKTQMYSQLEITAVEFKEGKIVVKGVTDLPNSSRLLVSIFEEDQKSAPLSRSCEVTEGTFVAFLTPPQEWQGNTQFLTVKVVFDPHTQIPAVNRATGNNGENLQSEKAVTQGKSTLLVTQGVVTLEF
ncbi:MAG: hypothetical protein HPY68_06515 [Candidatus Atribacteria bacterium]|nr:hypothetical protein [Candidatus Atribacteria bacterium]